MYSVRVPAMVILIWVKCWFELKGHSFCHSMLLCISSWTHLHQYSKHCSTHPNALVLSANLQVWSHVVKIYLQEDNYALISGQSTTTSQYSYKIICKKIPKLRKYVLPSFLRFCRLEDNILKIFRCFLWRIHLSFELHVHVHVVATMENGRVYMCSTLLLLVSTNCTRVCTWYKRGCQGGFCIPVFTTEPTKLNIHSCVEINWAHQHPYMCCNKLYMYNNVHPNWPLLAFQTVDQMLFV